MACAVRAAATNQRSTTVQNCVSFRHPRLERHQYQQEVWKKSHGVWLEDNLPPSDLLHHTIDIGFETRGAVSKDLLYLSLNFCHYSCLCLSCSCHFFHSCFLCSCSCGWCSCCLFPCHGMTHQCFAQPTLRNGHREQGSQSRARNHVLVSLYSTCHEPPCTPGRLRTSS